MAYVKIHKEVRMESILTVGLSAFRKLPITMMTEALKMGSASSGGDQMARFRQPEVRLV